MFELRETGTRAATLVDEATRLVLADRPEEALARHRGHRPAARQHRRGAARRERLGEALCILSDVHEAAGPPEAAAAALEEAVAEFRAVPGLVSAFFAGALNNQAMAMMLAARHDEARAASVDAVAMYRASGHEDLALGLWTFAEVRQTAGVELDEAVAAREEAVARYEAADDHRLAAARDMLEDVREPAR